MNDALRKCSQYLNDCVSIPKANLEKGLISELVLNSSDVKKDSLFFAVQGELSHGKSYIDHAIALGAIAIVLDSRDRDTIEAKNKPLIFIDGLKEKIPVIASKFYKAKQSRLVGVTGTNGKTTCSLLVHSAMQYLNKKSAYIGTLGVIDELGRKVTRNTTPDIFTLHKIISELDHQTIMLEVSSHGIKQGRVSGLDFHTKIFTNLTQDHLDYHGSMDDYRETKYNFIKHPSGTNLILDSTEELTEELLKINKHNIITTGLNQAATISAKVLDENFQGQIIEVKYKQQKSKIKTTLIGEFNIKNLLNSLGCLISLGEDFNNSCQALSSVRAIPGRMNQFLFRDQTRVIIDYAHTPDALEKILIAILKFNENKVITVLGCGGDRDQAKRPKMARIAEQYSDLIVLTNDNPRTESPKKIIEEMLRGVKDSSKASIIFDRGDAIRKAISLSRGGTILIAGKGHEETQDFGNSVIPFSDIQFIKNLIDDE
jgi:UDP-N-acetylmuramoyl-L-alanyl-D-glutamate--2,6-diaminopimelate ligase